MPEQDWTPTPGAIDEDVAVVVAVAEEQERKAWKFIDHLDDRSKDAILEFAKRVL